MQSKKKQKTLRKHDMNNLNNEETLRTFKETVANLLERKQEIMKKKLKNHGT